MFYFLGAAAVLALIANGLHVLLRHSHARRAAEKARQTTLDGMKDYMLDTTQLRGHDLVMSVWQARLKDGRFDPEAEVAVVAAATQVERQDGRRYDGRPLRQGWASTPDYADYFAFVDGFGDHQARYDAIYKATVARVAPRRWWHLRRTPVAPARIANPGLREVSEWAKTLKFN